MINLYSLVPKIDHPVNLCTAPPTMLQVRVVLLHTKGVGYRLYERCARLLKNKQRTDRPAQHWKLWGNISIPNQSPNSRLWDNNYFYINHYKFNREQIKWSLIVSRILPCVKQYAEKTDTSISCSEFIIIGGFFRRFFSLSV